MAKGLQCANHRIAKNLGNDWQRFCQDKFYDASPNIEHPWKWFFLISISSLPASAGITMQLEKPINHRVEYINWPIKNKKCGLRNLCSSMFYTLWKSESRENFCCLRPSVVSPLQETYTFLRWKKHKSLQKKLSHCQVFFTSFKMFFCWAWCDFESFLKGKLQASYVWTSKLVGCIGYRDQICSFLFFCFKTPKNCLIS